MSNEYVWAAMMLQKLGRPITPQAIEEIIRAAGGKPEPAMSFLTASHSPSITTLRYDVPNRLRDDEGTPAPAATTPKIFTGGDGSPDLPPAAAGCTNQRKSTEIRREITPVVT